MLESTWFSAKYLNAKNALLLSESQLTNTPVKQRWKGDFWKWFLDQ